MALLSENELPRLYDVGLDGKGLLLAWEVDKELLSPWKTTYVMEAEDIYIEKRDNAVEEMTENKLDRYYWRSQRSWDYGAGQQRFEQNLPGFPSSRAYLSSQGLDVFTSPSQATLLPSSDEILSLSNQGPNAPQKMVVTDNYVYVAAGQPNVKRFSALNANDAVTVSTATETAQNVFDMASDGSVVYVALGADGVHQAGTPTDTQRESFNSSAGYTLVNTPTVSADTSDFKEGTASLKVVSLAGTSTETKAVTGAPLDLSAVTNFKVWLKQEPPTTLTPSLINAFSTTTTTGANLSFTVTNPNANDLLLVWVNTKGLNAPTIQGTGWTQIVGMADLVEAGESRSQLTGWWRLVTSAEASTTFTVTATTGSSLEGVATLKQIRNVDTSNPVPGGAALSTFAATPGTSVTAQALSTSRDNNYIDLVCSANANPSGVAGPVTITKDAAFGVDKAAFDSSFLAQNTAHKIQGSAGTVSAATDTVDRSSSTLICMYAIQPPAGAPQQLEVRLQTSVGNYYSRLVTPPSGVWSRDVSIRTTDWTATGAPAWNNINSLVLVQTAVNTVHYDDLVSTAPAAFAHFSDPDYRALGWAKDRLYGAGIKTGTQWAFREVGSLATSKEWLVLPDGYSVTDIQELGPYVYFTANRTTVSKIYAFDGVNTPFIALTMPPGEQATKLQPFLGAGMLIGARRSGVTPTSGMGVIYRAFPQASGHLTIERVTTLGNPTDGRDYAPQASTAYLDQVYIGNNFADVPNQLSGLIAYYPATGGFARHLEAVTGHGPVAGMGVYQNKKVFTIDTDGVYIESPTGALVASGSLLSSVMDWNIDSNKVLMKGELATMPLPAGSTARLDYSLDQGSTFTTLGSSGATGNTVISVPLAASNITAQIAQTRAVLTPDTTGRVSPILKKTGLAAIYGLKPRRVFRLAIKAYSYMNLKNGVPHPQSGPGLSFSIEKTLQGLRDNQTIVQFQPPGWGEEQQVDNPNVRVGSLKIHRNWEQGSGWSDICITELFEVPS